MKQADTKRTCLLVLGAHRSGTSAISRLLNIHGCDLPATLMGPSPGNEHGHWESQAIADFDEELLESAGSRWDDIQAFNEAWYASARRKPYGARAKALLMSEFGRSPLFVLKDPRICRIAPFWLSVLEECGVEPAIVLPIRNPLGVADSIERRDERPGWYGSLIWLRHVLDAEHASRGFNRVFSGFDALRGDWRSQIDAIAKGLGLQFPRVSPISASEADHFIRSGNTEHHAIPTNDVLARRSELGSWLHDTFSIFARWIQYGEKKEDQEILDQIRSEFDRATFALGSCLLPSQTEGGAEQGVRRRIDLQNQLAARQSELAELQAQLVNASTHIEQSSAAHVQSHAEMSGHVAARDAEIARISHDLAHNQNELGMTRQAAQDLAHQLSARTQEWTQATGQVAELTTELTSTVASYEKRLKQYEADNATSNEAAVSAAQEIATLQGEIGEMLQAKHDFVHQLSLRDKERAQNINEIDNLKYQIGKLTTETSSLKEDLSSSEKLLEKRESEYAASLDAVTAKSKQDLASLQQKIELAAKVNDELASDLVVQNEELSSVKVALSSLDAEWSQAISQISDLKDKITLQESRFEEREEEYQAAREAATSSAEKDIATLRDEICQIERAKNDLIEKFSQRNAEWIQAADELADLRDKLAVQEKRTEQREAVISQYLDEITQLRGAHVRADKLESKLAKADVRLGRLTAERRRALTDVEQWRSAAAELERRIELLAKRQANVETSTQSVNQAEMDALRAENDLVRQGSVRTQQEAKSRFDEIAKLSKLLMEYETKLAEQQSQLAAHQAQLDGQQTEIIAQQAQIVEQEREISEQHVQLSGQQAHLTDRHTQLTDKQWLHEMSRILVRIPSWWHFMPTRMRRRREQDKLRKAGIFDAEAYLARNPDVAAAGMDPLKHYIMHGMNEQRDRSLG